MLPDHLAESRVVRKPDLSEPATISVPRGMTDRSGHLDHRETTLMHITGLSGHLEMRHLARWSTKRNLRYGAADEAFP